jgi:hypothetical protein
VRHWRTLAHCTLLALGLLCVGDPAGAGDARGALREGEHLTFDVTWAGIKAGQATLESRGLTSFNGRPAYHLVTTARSGPLISKFFRVEDRSESFVEGDPLRSLWFGKHLREGRYRHDSQTVFDHAAGQALFRYFDFSSVPKGISGLSEAEAYGRYVQQEYPLGANALDELAVLYYVRLLPLQPGQVYTAKVFASRKNWDLQVRVLRREVLDTALGRRDTLIVEPLLAFEGVFQQKGRMVVWLTNDAERVPVRMESEVKVGSFVSTLVRRQKGLAQTAAGHSRPLALGQPGETAVGR